MNFTNLQFDEMNRYQIMDGQMNENQFEEDDTLLLPYYA